MSLRVVFQAALALGAMLAVTGGIAIGLCHLVDPDMEILRRVEIAYRQIIFGFMFLTLFAVGAALLEALARRTTPAPVVPPPVEASAPAVPAPSRLAGLYHEMKTYVDLEMWELALEKANAIVKEHPGTREAELVGRNLNEIRWKAEPKFVSQAAPLTAAQAQQLRQKGLAAMYQHVKTYMDLEMWELARQKALAILKSFPDSPEAVGLMKDFDMIEKKARESSAAPQNVES